MDEPKSTYYIIRMERLNESQQVVTTGLLIGNLPTCDLWLNHPAVSRTQAGIARVGTRFYVTDLSQTNTTTLNWRSLKTGAPEALADGDVLQFGPFFLAIEHAGDSLIIRVTEQPGLTTAEAQARAAEQAKEQLAAETQAAASTEVAQSLALFWDRRRRAQYNPATLLHPQGPRPAGKARFFWEPTLDLRRAWPVALFVWSIIVVGAAVWAAARWRSEAFAPRPLSAAHARATLDESEAIARHANADACNTCHAQTARIEDNCAACHQTNNFVATVTGPHQQAHVDCLTCHTEHRGREFSPREAALKSCDGCHNDANIYRGMRMKTPHPMTGFGYPVVNSKWVWRGLSDEEWASKPDKIRAEMDKWVQTIKQTEDRERNRLVAQFHVLHVYRVRSVAGLRSDEEGKMECTSCHQFTLPTIDREMPQKQCVLCHNGLLDRQTKRVLIPADKPNCTSCHVQHIWDKNHWNPSLLAQGSAPRAEMRYTLH